MKAVPTMDEIINMTDEEVAATNRVLGIKLVKRYAIQVGAVIAITVATNIIARKFESSLGETED